MDRQFLVPVKNGDTETVQELIEISKKFGGTTHHHHHHHGRVLTMRQLLSVRECHGGPTALHLAAEHGHTEIVRVLLLENEANVNSSTNDKTPLDLAYESGHAAIALLLLQNGGETTFYSKQEYLFRAIQNNNPDLVGVLLEKDGAQVNHVYCRDDDNNNNNNDIDHHDPSTTPLLIACEKGYTQVASILLKHVANLHDIKTRKDGNSALHLASMNGHSETALLLLKHGANVHRKNQKDGNTALHLACIQGHYDIAQLLLENGALVNDMNYASSTPLHSVASSGNVKIALLLLQHDIVNVNCLDRMGSTPLQHAVEKGHDEVVSALLLNHHQSSVNVNIINKAGLTPLLSAMARGYYGIACLILKHADSPNVNIPHRDDEGWTPLLRATENGLVELASLLVQNKANVHATNEKGWTALHFASERGEVELSCLLLDHGADLNATNPLGISPLNVAKDGLMAKALCEHKERLELQQQKQQQQQQQQQTEVREEEKEAKVEAAKNATLDTQQQDSATNDSASISKHVTTTTPVSVDKLLETLVSQQSVLMTAVADKKTKRDDKREADNAVLNQRISHLNGEPKQKQQQKDTVISAIEHLEEEPKQRQQKATNFDAIRSSDNIGNFDVKSSIKELVGTLESQQKEAQKALETTLSTLIAAFSEKKHIETTVSAIEERLAALTFHEEKLKTENVILNDQKLTHFESQQQQQQERTAEAAGSCNTDSHAATLKTLLETLVSQQKESRNALMASISGMKHIVTNLSALQKSVVAFHVQDRKLRMKNTALRNEIAIVKGRVASLGQRLAVLEEQRQQQRHDSQPNNSVEQRMDNEDKHVYHSYGHLDSIVSNFCLVVLLVWQRAAVMITSIFTLLIPCNNPADHEDQRGNEVEDDQGKNNENEISMLVDVVAGIDEKLADWMQRQEQQQTSDNPRPQQQKKDNNKLKDVNTVSKAEMADAWAAMTAAATSSPYTAAALQQELRELPSFVSQRHVDAAERSLVPKAYTETTLTRKDLELHRSMEESAAFPDDNDGSDDSL